MQVIETEWCFERHSLRALGFDVGNAKGEMEDIKKWNGDAKEQQYWSQGKRE